MKKISFVCLSLLIFTACQNDSKKEITETTATTKDTIAAKATSSDPTTPETKEIPTLKACTEKQVDYETEVECIFKNKDVNEVYQATIKDQEIEKAELLLPDLPKESTTKEINKDGLLSISYAVSPKKTEIEFQFEGGVTTLSLEQMDKDVKRIIIHSAD